MFYHTEKHRYHPILDFTYWYVLISFRNWNIIKFVNKSTSSKYFDSFHNIVFYVIS